MASLQNTTTDMKSNTNGIGVLVLGIALITITFCVLFVEIFINNNPSRFIAMFNQSPSFDTLLTIVGEWAGMNILTYIALALTIRYQRSGKTRLSQFVKYYGVSALVLSVIL